MVKCILFFVMITGASMEARGANTASHREGTVFVHAAKVNVDRKGFLTAGSAQDKIWGYTDSPPQAGMTPERLNGGRDPTSEAAMRVRDQLSGNRMVIDPITDPMFVNANKAIANPTETLKKQEIVVVNMKEAVDRPCIETRDEEFDVINYAQSYIHYNKFEVSQFYNHCGNHPGWGKGIAQGCRTWRDRHLLRATRNPPADYEEIVTTWATDAHPDLESLFRAGKCRLKKEMPKEEGRASRMIPLRQG